MTTPFPNIDSPLKERVEGEFVRRMRKSKQLRQDFKNINLQSMNQAAAAPKIVAIAQPQGQYTPQGSVFRVQLSIWLQLPDPPPDGIDNAKTLEIGAGIVRQIANDAQAEGVFGLLFVSESQPITQNTRSRLLTFTIITA